MRMLTDTREGWIEHDGSECPVDDAQYIEAWIKGDPGFNPIIAPASVFDFGSVKAYRLVK